MYMAFYRPVCVEACIIPCIDSVSLWGFALSCLMVSCARAGDASDEFGGCPLGRTGINCTECAAGYYGSFCWPCGGLVTQGNNTMPCSGHGASTCLCVHVMKAISICTSLARLYPKSSLFGRACALFVLLNQVLPTSHPGTESWCPARLTCLRCPCRHVRWIWHACWLW